jgi:hypothetical protein
MQDISDKADSTAGATGQLPAAEYNDHKNEQQDAVVRSGQTLSAATLLQQAKAYFINGTAAETVVDSGSANSIILAPLTGSSGLVVPDNYSELNGAILSFEKSAANTSTSVTVNFGQTGTELGAKTLVRSDLSVPAIGDVIGKCFIKWDNANDQWILLRNETDTYKYVIAATGAIAPKFANNIYEIDTSGGNVVISALPTPDFIGQRIDFVVSSTGTGTITAGTGITFDQVLTSAEGATVIAVDVGGTLQWELVIDRKAVCKAWVNFNGTGVVNIRDSYNCSSISDNGVGDYTINFTNAMNDANYSVSGTCGTPGVGVGMVADSNGTHVTSSFSLFTINPTNASLIDRSVISVQIFGQ